MQGYRRPRSPTRSSGARAALTAAGIDCELGATPVELPEDVEAVLAWAVREGATNVIRHSGAQHCAIRVDADGARAAVEIEDDGSGVASRRARLRPDAGCASGRSDCAASSRRARVRRAGSGSG